MEVTSTRPAKKILYVITKSNWGGAQRYVYDLAVASKAAGFDVTVAYGSSGEMAERLKAAGVRTIAIPSLARDVSVSGDIAAYRHLTQIITHERPDIVHLNSSKAGAMGALAARLAGTPCIIFTAHGWALNEARPWWQKIPIALIYALTLLLSHKTIAVSEAVRRDMGHMPGSKKITVIHNGIAEPLFKNRNEARRILLPNNNNKFWFGITAELHPVKRITDAVDALGRIATQAPDAALVILGEGQERHALEKQITEHHLSERVFLLGHTPQAAQYLHAFDVALLPSRSEGLAYAVVEAGYAGLPVIASNVGGLPEIIENNTSGILIPPQKPAALAQAMLELYNNSAERERLGLALQKQVHTKFSLEQMVAKTIALY